MQVPPENSENSLKQVLLQAAKDLYYPSESDEPFAYFEWDLSSGQSLTEADVRRFTHKNRQTPVEKQTLEAFFRRVTEVQDWHQPEDTQQVERFKALQESIKANLAGVQVFRVGRTEVDVYIVGKTPSGKWAGLSTKLTET